MFARTATGDAPATPGVAHADDPRHPCAPPYPLPAPSLSISIPFVLVKPSPSTSGARRCSPLRPPPRRSVAELPELSRLKCAGHHPKGNTGSNALQTEQFLVCRVTSRYNHRFLDRTSIPRTKASLEILQPYLFYNTGIVLITLSSKYLIQIQT